MAASGEQVWAEYHIQVKASAGMRLFLPQSKGDRENLGTTHYLPVLKCLCPVQTYLDWIVVVGIARYALEN